jgi:predicted MFS family arabinose efflux permease
MAMQWANQQRVKPAAKCVAGAGSHQVQKGRVLGQSWAALSAMLVFESTHTATMTAQNLSSIQERWLLWTLAAIQFTHIVDFMVMMPLGPQLIQLFHLSDAGFGVLVSSYSIAAGVAGLVASVYVDRFDRRRLLLMVYAGFAVATLACAWAPTYAMLMLARILAGVFGGVLGSLVQTIVGDVVPFERRGQAMGVVMSAFALATVAGLPVALWLASRWGWHWPFLSIAVLSAVCWLAAWRWVPRLNSHLAAQPTHGPWQRLYGVLTQPNHWQAYGLSVFMMLGSFSIIPYITIFSTTNVGVRQQDVPLVYLVGGLATLFTSRLWGRLADRHGKVFMFRCLALLAAVPMVTLTYLSVTPLWVLLLVTTAFFVFVSGRMVPGMALLTQVAKPEWRGSFMSVNSALQSATMGVGSWLGGMMISRSPDGLLVGYEHCGWLALVSSLVIVWWVGRLHTPSHKL